MIKRLFIAAVVAVIATVAANAQDLVKPINQEEFMKEIFNYRNDTVKPVRPAIVDFWAPWCAPCLRLAPVLDDLAKEYAGKVDFYKLNIDDNQQLAQELGIGSIPLVVLFPSDERPMRGMTGVQTKEFIDKAIKEYLLPQSAPKEKKKVHL